MRRAARLAAAADPPRLRYADVRALSGEVGTQRGGFRLHKLEAACQQHALQLGGHRAAADCRATLALIQMMAATTLDTPVKTVNRYLMAADAVEGELKRADAAPTNWRGMPTSTGGATASGAKRQAKRAIAADVLRAARGLPDRLTEANTHEWERLKAGQPSEGRRPADDFYRVSALQQAYELARDVLYFLVHPGTRACDACRGPVVQTCILCRTWLCDTPGCQRHGAETWEGDWVCQDCVPEAMRRGLVARLAS